jgi:glutamyl-tRNA synthetase
MKVRTRFAPSPTGQLHLGNARTAILNWLFARHHGGAFVVRFEDTDLERNIETAEAAILESLDWLGLDRDEDPTRGGPFGPYRQSERLDLYRAKADWLLERGLAYRCYCLPEELDTRRDAALEEGGQPRYDGRCRDLSEAEEATFRTEGRTPAVRFRVDPGPITVEDRVKGRVTIEGSEFGDMVILRSDGRPTYNFAVVVDDLAMEISHVIRGVGHLANTPKQILLYRAFDCAPPEFVHIPTVLAPGGGKLSKRAGAPGLLEYRDEGYHPAAVVNYLSLLSWSAETGEEFLTPSALIEQIDLDRLGASNAILDVEKMRWLSGQHIRNEAPEVLAERLLPFVDFLGLEPTALQALAEVTGERVQLLSEAREEAELLLGEPDLAGQEATEVLGSRTAVEALQAIDEAWSNADWSRVRLRETMREAANQTGLRGKSMFQPIRVALTGRLSGPELPDVAFVLGRERTRRRLAHALTRAGPQSGDPHG